MDFFLDSSPRSIATTQSVKSKISGPRKRKQHPRKMLMDQVLLEPINSCEMRLPPSSPSSQLSTISRQRSLTPNSRTDYSRQAFRKNQRPSHFFSGAPVGRPSAVRSPRNSVLRTLTYPNSTCLPLRSTRTFSFPPVSKTIYSKRESSNEGHRHVIVNNWTASSTGTGLDQVIHRLPDLGSEVSISPVVYQVLMGLTESLDLETGARRRAEYHLSNEIRRRVAAETVTDQLRHELSFFRQHVDMQPPQDPLDVLI